MRVIWSPLALERVAEIVAFIAQDNIPAARRWAESIFSKVERLHKFPESGRLLPEIRRLDIREIIYGNYRIIYRVKPRQIDILTVRHGKQRLPIGEMV